MPRLLSIIHGPTFGGAHNEWLQLHEPLTAAGWEATVVLPQEAGNAVQRMRAAGVEVITIPLGRLRAVRNPLVQGRFLAGVGPEIRRLRTLMRDRQVDLVQVHGDTNPQGALAARREGVAIVWHLLDTRTPAALRRLTIPAVRRLADCVTAVGHEVARAHPGIARLGDRLFIVAPPVDVGEFHPDPELRAAARAELEVPEGALLVGTVGNLNPQKGHEWLIRAAAAARVHLPLELRILGASSPGHAGYERRLTEEAARLGFGIGAGALIRDPGERVAKLLPAFDIFALASVPRSEGMPTVILEAMACGVPVVATNVGAVSEALSNGDTGDLVPPLDTDALSAGLVRLGSSPERRALLAGRGRERVQRCYALDRCARVRLTAYRRALEHHAGRRRS